MILERVDSRSILTWLPLNSSFKCLSTEHPLASVSQEFHGPNHGTQCCIGHRHIPFSKPLSLVRVYDRSPPWLSPTSQSITSKSPCLSIYFDPLLNLGFIFLWFPTSALCSSIVYMILGWLHHPPELLPIWLHQYPLCADVFSYHQIYLRHLNWAPDPPQAKTYVVSALRCPISPADLLVAPGQHSLFHAWALSSTQFLKPQYWACCCVWSSPCHDSPRAVLEKAHPRSSCYHRWESGSLRGPVSTDTLWRCPEHRPSSSFGSPRKPRHCTPERLKALSLTRWWVKTQQWKPIIGECAKEYSEEIPQGEHLGRWVFMGVHQTRDCLTVLFPVDILFCFGLHLNMGVNMIIQEKV